MGTLGPTLPEAVVSIHTDEGDALDETSLHAYLLAVAQYLDKLIDSPDSVLRFLLQDESTMMHDLVDELLDAANRLRRVADERVPAREQLEAYEAGYHLDDDAGQAYEQMEEAGLTGSAMRLKWRILRARLSGSIRSPKRVMAALGGAAKVIGSVVRIDPRVERVVEALETARDAVEVFSE
jgi:hypothetical protein